MPTDPLLEHLVRWEELRAAGQEATPEQLCPDDKALQEALRRRLARRQRFQEAFDPTPPPNGSPSVISANLPKIEGYEILDVLGHGGMGVVYKARQTKLNRLVAIKMILPGSAPGQYGIERFRTEAEAVARLRHPHIVQIYEIAGSNTNPYLALEYVDGGSLAARLSGMPWSARQAAELVKTIADAVEHAHRHGIVHRDLKPANVLLESRSENEGSKPKIADFGLAKLIDSDSGQTRTGTVLGSPSYMAPEQAEGRLQDIGPATDVYAIGAILYELLTGRPPFVGETLLATLDQVRNQDPIRPRSLNRNIHADLETICLKCLEKNPADRYGTAAALAGDLGNFLADEPIHAKPADLWKRIDRTLRRNTHDKRFASMGQIMLGVASMPVLVHGMAYWLFHDQPSFPFTITLTSVIMVTAMNLFLLLGSVGTLQDIPGAQRRQAWTIWLANVAATLITWVVMLVTMPSDRPDLLYVCYPIWMVMVGICYLAFAHEVGFLYLLGGGFMAVGLVSCFFLPWSWIIVGVAATANLFGQGIHLTRLSRNLNNTREPAMASTVFRQTP